jgi:hypothetical protein
MLLKGYRLRCQSIPEGLPESIAAQRRKIYSPVSARYPPDGFMKIDSMDFLPASLDGLIKSYPGTTFFIIHEEHNVHKSENIIYFP